MTRTRFANNTGRTNVVHQAKKVRDKATSRHRGHATQDEIGLLTAPIEMDAFTIRISPESGSPFDLTIPRSVWRVILTDARERGDEPGRYLARDLVSSARAILEGGTYGLEKLREAIAKEEERLAG